MARYPNVPTLKESGYNMSYSSPMMIIGPKGMPQPVVQKLHDVLKKAMEAPEFLEILKKYDMVPVYLNPEDCTKAVAKESEQIKRVVEKLGLLKK